MIKPLEGDLFRKFKDQIMGMIPAEDPGPEKSQPVKAQPRKGTAKKRQAKERQGICFQSLVLPIRQHHRSVFGEVKNGQYG